ncbi:MAG: outer membrane protein [Parvibaculaceae bacterium]|jgi:outer membrane protein|nr:outer membrane beta-barrel protein [Parvibaculaceae bacterium]
MKTLTKDILRFSLVGLMTSSAIVTGAMIDAARAEDSPWLVRARAVMVVPDESASVTVLGGSVDIDTTVIPEIDITYFFSENWAAELVLGTSNHEVTATPSNTDLGDVWLLPPTLTLQYHFSPKAQFRPYIGAGVNYTMFYGEDSGAAASIDYDNAFGVALQGGMDYDLGDNWVFNVDVKKIWLSTDVSINGGAITADVDIDPWFFGTGIGYRF